MKKFICILLILMLAFNFTGCSKNIPEGVSEEVYNDCLKILDEVEKNLKNPTLGLYEKNDCMMFSYNIEQILRNYTTDTEYKKGITDQEKNLLEQSFKIYYFFGSYGYYYSDNYVIKENGNENLQVILNDEHFNKEGKPILEEYIKMLNLDYSKYKKKYNLN